MEESKGKSLIEAEGEGKRQRVGGPMRNKIKGGGREAKRIKPGDDKAG